MIGLRILFVWIVFAACASSGSDAEQKQRRCEQLRDHLIEIRLAAVGQDHATPIQLLSFPKPVPGQLTPREPVLASPPVDIEAHRTAMKQALGDRFVGGCNVNMSAQQVDCALAAKDQSAVNACSASSPPPTKTASN